MSRYQKGKTNLDFTEARDSEWQWHQLGRMQVCISLQTDNHGGTPLLKFFTGRMPFLPPNQQRQSTEGRSYTGTHFSKLTGGLFGFWWRRRRHDLGDVVISGIRRHGGRRWQSAGTPTHLADCSVPIQNLTASTASTENTQLSPCC